MKKVWHGVLYSRTWRHEIRSSNITTEQMGWGRLWWILTVEIDQLLIQPKLILQLRVSAEASFNPTSFLPQHAIAEAIVSLFTVSSFGLRYWTGWAWDFFFDVWSWIFDQYRTDTNLECPIEPFLLDTLPAVAAWGWQVIYYHVLFCFVLYI